MQVQLFRDVNHQPIEIDETLPLVFIDIDGVINPLPYERVWIGPEGPVSDFMLWDPANWRWEQLSCDATKNYEITREFEVSIDTWQWERPLNVNRERDDSKRHKRVIIALMDEMLQELRKIFDENSVQVIYCTYWRSEALRLLEPTLQLGALGYLEWNTTRDMGHRNKLVTVARIYEQLELTNPFVMIDDEALSGVTSSTPLWHSRESPKLAEQLNSIARFLMEPDARWGISREQMERLSNFLSSVKVQENSKL